MKTTWLILLTLALCASLAHAQVTTVDHYDLAVYKPGDNPATAAPFSLTQFPLGFVSCNRLPSEIAVDNEPNPEVFAFDDLDHAAKECRINVRALVLALPIGTGYHAAIRAVDSAGRTYAWTNAPMSFRRAPRGVPCPGGQPGVLVTERADINGKPVVVSLCILVQP